MQLSNGTRKGIAVLLGLLIAGNLIRLPSLANSAAGYGGAVAAMALLAYGAYRIWPSDPDEPVEAESASA